MIAALLWVLYCLTFWAIAALPLSPLVGIYILGNTLSFSVMFVIGHDAAHHALFKKRWKNDLLAQICFLPALQPVSSWQVRHNIFHHGFAGFRPKDPGYPPATLEEYLSWGPFRRAFYRFQRSIIGFGFIYFVDGWLKFGFSRADMKKKQVLRLRWEIAALLTFVLGQLAIAIAISSQSPWLAWILSVGIPFLIWNYVMSFVTYLHHTNPQVPWFDDYSEWRAKKSVQLTVHVRFPKFLDVAYLNIMQHPAHHENARTAWYELPHAQAALARRHDVVELPLKLSSILDVFKKCKLYDSRRHCWQDYTGTITSVCLRANLEEAVDGITKG